MTNHDDHDQSSAVLLTGATGFVGGELLPSLAEEGSLRCLVRDPSGLPEFHRGLAVEADLSDAETLRPALEGMELVYYLVHSMEAGGDDFSDRDKQAAENYVAAASEAGVRRTIYLGGIGGGEGTSEHLDSRHEVEEILADASPEFVALKASMIVGAGSGSFASLVRIVARLPVLALPDWRTSRTQPIAIGDVVKCLLAARSVDPGSYEIAGPDELSIEAMIETVGDILGERRPSVSLPFSNSKLEGAAAALVSGEDRELMEPLMAGLKGDLSVTDNRIEDVFGVEPTGFEEAARLAIEQMPEVGDPA